MLTTTMTSTPASECAVDFPGGAEEGGRRRSTFYVPLAAADDSSVGDRLSHRVDAEEGEDDACTASTSSRTSTDTPRRRRDDAMERTRRPTLSRASPHKTPKPLVTVTKTIDGPKVPYLMTVKSSPGTSPSASPRVRSPLLKVSTKILSSSAQALESLNRSSSSQFHTPESSPQRRQTPSKTSPRTHQTLTSSRSVSVTPTHDSKRASPAKKLSRSSSTILTRSRLTRSSDKSPVSGSVPAIVVEQASEKRILSSFGALKQERKLRSGGDGEEEEEEDEENQVHS
ncbi:hypothetical protein LSTR_LSTR012710, partial [Laodelphax striatellus]